MTSWSAKVSPDQHSNGYSTRQPQAGRVKLGIAEVRIDPHPQNGVVLRRLSADGGDIHSTRHRDANEAKRAALNELQVRAEDWTAAP
jgi:hypothetical protein